MEPFLAEDKSDLKCSVKDTESFFDCAIALGDPEVTHTQNGKKILQNFVDICGLKNTWDLDAFSEQKYQEKRINF